MRKDEYKWIKQMYAEIDDIKDRLSILEFKIMELERKKK